MPKENDHYCDSCGGNSTSVVYSSAETALRIAELEAALKAARYYLHNYARGASPGAGEMIASIDRLLPDLQKTSDQ